MSTARPLRIERLAARRFRNLASLDIEPGAHFNVIHGDNGAGKSNLLEAIHYLGALRSFRGARTDDMVALGEHDARLKARVAGDAAARTFEIGLGRGAARKLAIDGKRPRSIGLWYGALQVVLFHPGDVGLAGGPPEPRRAFLDRILEQMDPTYASALASYTKALRSRNRLLKGERPDRRAIGAFDEILATSGAAVGAARARLVQELAPRAVMAFEDVVGAELPLEVHYEARVAPEPEVIRRALENSYAKDLARGFTAEGPHGDDLALRVRSVSAKHHASQGQQRAIVLALKVAELDVLHHHTGKVPVLLLDDVSSELDRARNRRLFEMLGHLGGQVFLTTTHPEFILLEENRADFRVQAGTVERVG